MNANFRKLISVFLALAMLAVAMPTQAKPAETSSMPEGLFQAALESTSQSISAQGANSGGLDFAFSAHGLQAGNANWGITLNGFGRGEAVNALGAADAKEVEGRVQYERPELTEWYRDTAFGLEQGFTIHQSPFGKGTLVLRLALSTDMAGTLDENGRGLSFSAGDGKTLRYDHLKVWDADGKELDAQMAYAPGQVEIRVNDAGAAYPITIDPLIYMEQKAIATDRAFGDGFGASVAISGNTAIVGAPSDDIGAKINQGAAYIFVKSGSAWNFAAKLTASDGAASDEFGHSVAISGNTIVVGAPYALIGSNVYQGAAYIFAKPSGGWATTSVFAAKLTASDGAGGDNFGWSVALDIDTALVGARGDDGYQGSAYVFVKPGGGWATGTETAKLTASDGVASDTFGYSVAFSGTTALVGAHATDNYKGSAYVFVKPGGGWATMTETAKLTASDRADFDSFGYSVAISGNTAIIGANGDDVGAYGDQGSAYIFIKPGGGWATTSTFAAKLTASDGAASDVFGRSVAIAGNAAIVGAPVGNGAAYIFVKPGGGWATTSTFTAKLTASDGAAGDFFGNYVALSGNTILVGAHGNDSYKGAAYFFGPHTDLSVSAAVNPASAKPGATVYLTASIANYGETYSGINQVINAPLPTGLTYVTSEATHGTYNSATGKWTVGAFASGATATLTITATVNPQAPQTRTFTASLVGTDTNNSNNSASAKLKVLPFTAAFRSQAANDGWVLESTETSGVGGTMNSASTTFNLGDNAARKQYRGILSFNTQSLPNTAVITKVTLKVKQQGIVGGGNPVSAFQGFLSDIKKGMFGTSALQLSDFQATAQKTVGPLSPALSGGWYSLNLTSARAYINKLATNGGLTQIRLRFKLDDDNNALANYLSLYSGDHATAANRPTLIIEYYVP